MVPEEIVPKQKYDNNGKNEKESQNLSNQESEETIAEEIEQFIDNLVAEHNNVREKNDCNKENTPESKKSEKIEKKS